MSSVFYSICCVCVCVPGGLFSKLFCEAWLRWRWRWLVGFVWRRGVWRERGVAAGGAVEDVNEENTVPCFCVVCVCVWRVAYVSVCRGLAGRHGFPGCEV